MDEGIGHATQRLANSRERSCSDFATCRLLLSGLPLKSDGIRRADSPETMIERIGSGLEHYLTLLSMREKLAASNIANVDTPGYRTRDLDFQAALSSVMANASPEIKEVEGLYNKNDGNNVSLDREARMLSENALQFSVASGLVKEQLKQVRMAISEGATQ